MKKVKLQPIGRYNLLRFTKDQKIVLQSITQLLELLEESNIEPENIHHLILPDNEISDISGIHKFSNLKELNLVNNKIEYWWDDATIEFFRQRIHSYSSPYVISLDVYGKNTSFVLLLNGNPLLLYKELAHESDFFLGLASSMEEGAFDIKSSIYNFPGIEPIRSKLIDSLIQTRIHLHSTSKLSDLRWEQLTKSRDQIRDYIKNIKSGFTSRRTKRKFKEYYKFHQNGLLFLHDLPIFNSQSDLFVKYERPHPLDFKSPRRTELRLFFHEVGAPELLDVLTFLSEEFTEVINEQMGFISNK